MPGPERRDGSFGKGRPPGGGGGHMPSFVKPGMTKRGARKGPRDDSQPDPKAGHTRPSAAPRRNAHPLDGKPPVKKPAPAAPAVPADAAVAASPVKDGAITLSQFLKVAEICESGGHAKARVRAGGILVNGAEELRPARQLQPGDIVTVDGDVYEITKD